MKKAIILSIALGTVSLLGGGSLIAIGVVASDGNETVTNVYALSGEIFTNFDFDLGVADVEFIKSENEKKIVVQESKKAPHVVEVEGDTLKIVGHDSKKWHENLFDFDFFPKKVSIHLPAGEYGGLKIKNSAGDVSVPSGYFFHAVDIDLATGNLAFNSQVVTSASIASSVGKVELSGVNAQTLSIATDTGKADLTEIDVLEKIAVSSRTGSVSLSHVKSKDLDVRTTTGRIDLTNTEMQNHANLRASTGYVVLHDSSAGTLDIETSTGDVTGTLLSPKIFDVRSSTGRIDVPSSSSGGLCKVRTSTGDVRFSIKS